MRTSLKISRGLQLLGAAIFVVGIVSCSQGASSRAMSWAFIFGLLAVIGGKAYEWMTKE